MGDSVGKLVQRTKALAEGKFTQELRPHFSGELGQLAMFLDTGLQKLQVLSPTMGSSVHLVLQVAQAVADIFHQTETSTNSMLGLMEEMLPDQDRLLELVREVKGNDSPAGDSSSIEKITEKSRDDLIRLTNSLALQNEVKELATQTAEAMENISHKIGTIQNDAKGAVGAIGQVSEVINQIDDIASTIASAVEEQSATTAEVGRNIEEASHRGAEITQNITGVVQAAQSTVNGAAETRTASQELARLSAELHQIVRQFQYGTEPRDMAMSKPGRKVLVSVKPYAAARVYSSLSS